MIINAGLMPSLVILRRRFAHDHDRAVRAAQEPPGEVVSEGALEPTELPAAGDH